LEWYRLKGLGFRMMMVMMIMIMMVAVVLCVDVQGRGQEFDVFKCIQNII